jgi:hypothetical protein
MPPHPVALQLLLEAEPLGSDGAHSRARTVQMDSGLNGALLVES